MSYYIYKDNKKHGPFQQEELASHLTSRSTLVWKEGWKDWRKADDVEELKDIVNKIPPEPKTSRVKFFERFGRLNKKKLFIGGVLMLFFSSAIYLGIGGYAIYDLEHRYELGTYEPDNYYNQSLEEGEPKIRLWKDDLKHKAYMNDYFFYRKYFPVIEVSNTLSNPTFKDLSEARFYLALISIVLGLMIVLLVYYRFRLKTYFTKPREPFIKMNIKD